MKSRLQRKKQAPLADYRKARLDAENQDSPATAHFVAVLRRQAEAAKLREIHGQLEPPAKIDGKKLTETDVQAYALAINYARGTAKKPEEFIKLTDIMTRKHNVRFFMLCAAAMGAAKLEKSPKFSPTDGHRMAALQAKLELEKNLGSLPTQRQVKERAFQIVSIFIKNKNQNFAPLEPESKRWSKILKSVNLGYLKPKVRGKAI